MATCARMGIGLCCAVLLLASCRKEKEHGGLHPLVQVGDAFLYEEELNAVVPPGLSAKDSAAVADKYIRHWIEEEVLYGKAKRNIRDSKRMERMVEEYRRSLVVHDYKQRLIQQQLAEELTEEELLAFYEKNKPLFVLEEPVMKGIFIKAPLSAPGLKDLKKWYKENSEEALEQIEKFALRNAVIFEYFYDHWLKVSEMEGKITIDLAERSKDFGKLRDIETEDGEYCYLLHIEEYVPMGEVKPYELARREIVDLLTNNRQVEFMRNVKNDLYNEAHERGRIKYYRNEAIETNGTVSGTDAPGADDSTRQCNR